MCPQDFFNMFFLLLLVEVVATKAEKGLGIWKLCCSPFSVPALREFYLFKDLNALSCSMSFSWCRKSYSGKFPETYCLLQELACDVKYFFSFIKKKIVHK